VSKKKGRSSIPLGEYRHVPRPISGSLGEDLNGAVFARIVALPLRLVSIAHSEHPGRRLTIFLAAITMLQFLRFTAISPGSHGSV
jgi:hypothetical protein